MYLRYCLQELRIQLGETDLFLRNDGTDGDTHGRQDSCRMPDPFPEPLVRRSFATTRTVESDQAFDGSPASSKLQLV